MGTDAYGERAQDNVASREGESRPGLLAGGPIFNEGKTLPYTPYCISRQRPDKVQPPAPLPLHAALALYSTFALCKVPEHLPSTDSRVSWLLCATAVGLGLQGLTPQTKTYIERRGYIRKKQTTASPPPSTDLRRRIAGRTCASRIFRLLTLLVLSPLEGRNPPRSPPLPLASSSPSPSPSLSPLSFIAPTHSQNCRTRGKGWGSVGDPGRGGGVKDGRTWGRLCEGRHRCAENKQ